MKKLTKNIMGFTTAGVALGVGAVAVGKTGASTAGFTAASEMMSPLGTAMMGTATIRIMNEQYGKTGRAYHMKKGRLKGIWGR